MHDDRRQVEDRIARILRERLRPAVYPRAVPLTVETWPLTGDSAPAEPVGAAGRPAPDAGYVLFRIGSPWGPPWSTTWFRVRGTVPADWAGRRVEAVIDLGFEGEWSGFQAEALVFDPAGRPIKGLQPGNRYVPIAARAAGRQPVELLIEAAANPQILRDDFVPTSLGDPATAGDAPLYRFRQADLAVLDDQVWHLVHDLEVLDDLMRALPVSDPRRHQLLRGIERALDGLDLDDVAGSADTVRAGLAPLLSVPAHAGAYTISAVGHAHLDTAWLWPLRETRRKVARTFANALALARDYPELVFAAPQAQHYAWVRQDHPQLFDAVRDAVAAGTWAPVGGMWVEADGNLPGGEALVRQLVQGKRFFLAEFGVETRGVWLPDSFGYSAAWPQLALLAGNDWFLTQKMSWNQSNPFPHHSFWWEGIDGSRVFTHFPPGDTYNASLRGSELRHAVENYAEAGGGSRSLLPFGYGDGGGGPCREMLERARRVADLEGSPRVRLEHPDAFFAAARAEYPNAPVWSGELYLELHRGTFTSQARTKAGNRRSEHLLREAELWAASAAVLAAQAYSYPYDQLDRLWRTVLVHQFHDVLPGTSIAWVHRETEAAHAAVHGELERLICQAAAALAGPDASPRMPWLLNASPFRREGVPAGGAARVPDDVHSAASADEPVRTEVTAGGVVLDNGLVRVRVAADGTLASVVDLAAGREVLAGGARGNLLQLHPDLPNHWDAWDVDRHYRRTARDLTDTDEVGVVEDGPLVGAVRVVRSFGASRIEQTIVVRAGCRRVDIRNQVDWREREKLLKASFPIDLHADRVASEIQFGHVHRPTHTNTSWDAARFEVYAHRWLHAGEPGYGVALLTDATYGHDAIRSTRPDGGTTTTIRLSLLRAPRCPDPEADQGRHVFSYALLPGADVEDAVAQGYALNLPLRRVPGGAAVPPPLIAVAGDRGAIVEAVKLADDRSGDVVVRVYEAFGGRASARLTCAVPVTQARPVDLLERPIPDDAPEVVRRAVGFDAGAVRLTLRPFQVVTVRLSIRRDPPSTCTP